MMEDKYYQERFYTEQFDDGISVKLQIISIRKPHEIPAQRAQRELSTHK